MNRRSALPSIVALLHCQKRRSPTSETLSLGGQAGANFHPHDANLSPCLFGSSRRPSRLGLGRGWRCEAGCSRAPPAAAHSQWSTASPRPWQPPPARLSSGIGVPVPAARPKRAGPPLRRLVATVTLLWTLALPLLCLRSCPPPAPPPAPPPEDATRPPLPPLTLLLFATQVIPPSRPSASPLPFTPATASAAATARCCTSNTPLADLRTLTAKIGGAVGAATCKGSTLT